MDHGQQVDVKTGFHRSIEGLDRVITAFLFVFALVQPLSIAGTEIAYACAALAWLARLAIVRRGVLQSSPLDLPILVYLLLCTISTLLAPLPASSWEGMRKVSLVFVLLVVAHNIPSVRRAKELVAVLFFGALVSIAYTGWNYAAGIGLRVYEPRPDSVFYRAGIHDKDLFLRVDDRFIRTPQEFVKHLEAKPRGEPLRLWVVHYGSDVAKDAVTFIVPTEALPRPVSLDMLGARIEGGRPYRARGFYSHYVSYAEVLQLIIALAFGYWLSCRHRWAPTGLGLAALVLVFGVALGATLTRASWLAASFSCSVQIWFYVRRRWVRAVLPALLLLAAAGTNMAMRHWRGVSVFDPREGSSGYRLLMWLDGLRLIREHPWFGVGMHTIRDSWWKFDLAAYRLYGLRSHFHSTPIQLAVELGLPALAVWMALMGVYWVMLARLVKRASEQGDAMLHGLTLGLLGGTSGFLVSSVVHYNFGDSLVVLLFWFLAGMAVALRRRLVTMAA